MKITPPSGCVAAVYYDSALIFCIGENWDAKEKIEHAIADCTSFERVQLSPPEDFGRAEQSLTLGFVASYDAEGEGFEETGFVELEWISLY